MGFDSFSAGSKAAWFLMVTMFAAGSGLRAADAPATGAVTNAAAGAIENSVVKIFSTVRYPDPYKPWTKQSPEDITGSGVVIEGKRILTNAHVRQLRQPGADPGQPGRGQNLRHGGGHRAGH